MQNECIFIVYICKISKIYRFRSPFQKSKMQKFINKIGGFHSPFHKNNMLKCINKIGGIKTYEF